MAEGVLELRLVPSSAYRSLASSKAGLFATIVVTFAAPGQRTLSRDPAGQLSRALPSARTAKRPRIKAARHGESGRGAR